MQRYRNAMYFFSDYMNAVTETYLNTVKII